uniref:Leucoanthocyanidin dioxygenase n=1 Tax=Pohlia nutans TaxID=140635 RepID=A0A4P8JG14_9BRYO|nr:leucoanthocyanidin dioxygenase [Pohlia nutans]
MPQMVQQLLSQAGGLSQVPSRFIQPVEERPESEQGCTTIPVIDMKGIAENGNRIIAEIARACQEWGFFQVINHGVAPSLMEEFRDLAHEFFSLGQEEKEVNAIQPGKCVGYGRFFEQSDGVANWADNLILFSYGEEQRLAQPCMPPKPKRFREVVEKYGSAMFKLFTQLLELISAGLGLQPDAIAKQAKINDPGAAIRTDFNCYPPCPQPKLVLGSAPHADRGVLTVLQQDRVSGLQVAKDGKWFPVPPAKNAFVINLGDQMQIMSNGKYKSIVHRAVANQTETRYSFANFLMPADQTVIQPMAELLSASSPAVYRPIRFGEYIGGYSYLFKPLNRNIDSFRVIPQDCL